MFRPIDAVLCSALLLALAVPAGAQTNTMAYGSAVTGDVDTQCAAVFGLLAQGARVQGMPSSGYEAGLMTAERFHLAAYPAENLQRYSLYVADSVQGLRAALAQGLITINGLVTAAQGCAARYNGN